MYVQAEYSLLFLTGRASTTEAFYLMCFVRLRLRLAWLCTAPPVVVDHRASDLVRGHVDLIARLAQLRAHCGSTSGGGWCIGGRDISGTLPSGEQQIERWQHNEGQYGRREQPTNDHHRQRFLHF